MLKKEKDSESKQRLADLEADIEKLEREFSDLNEIWKSEKAALQGTTKVKEQIEQANQDLETARREQDDARMRENQERKSVAWGTSVSVGVDLVGNQTNKTKHTNNMYQRIVW